MPVGKRGPNNKPGRKPKGLSASVTFVLHPPGWKPPRLRRRALWDFSQKRSGEETTAASTTTAADGQEKEAEESKPRTAPTQEAKKPQGPKEKALPMKAVPKKRRAAETTDDDNDVLKAKHFLKVAEPQQRCL